MDVILTPTGDLHGNIAVPADKAICHRAVFLASLADGETIIRPWPGADDCQRTLELMEGLGVRISRVGNEVRILGRGTKMLQGPSRELWCGESGTTLRLAAGFIAGQQLRARLNAGPSLCRRPMRRIIEPLTEMGARIDAKQSSANSAELYPPLTIHGSRSLRGIRYELPVASAQVKSAIMLAAISANGSVTVIEPQATRDHTERMLLRAGISVVREGSSITIDPGQVAPLGVVELPGDVSSAAFFIVAAACVIGSRITVHGVGLNPTRVGFINVLSRMGAQIKIDIIHEAWEPSGSISIESQVLRGIAIPAAEVASIIDELPVLMVAACCAQGTSRFEGLGELRLKETDRISSMADGLSKLGARIRISSADVVEIEGGGLRGALVESNGDHRSAMSLAVAGLAAEGSTTIRDAGCVSKSFPTFFETLRLLAGISSVKIVDNAPGLC